MANISHVIADEWEGIYDDGVLVCDGHSIDLTWLITHFKLGTSDWLTKEQENRLMSTGRLPNTLKELEDWKYQQVPGQVE